MEDSNMKKNYVSPAILTVNVHTRHILAGSMKLDDENAKSFGSSLGRRSNDSFDDDEE